MKGLREGTQQHTGTITWYTTLCCSPPSQISHQNTALGIYIFNKRSRNKSHHCTWAHLGLSSLVSSLIVSQIQRKLGAKGGHLTASALGQGLQLCDLTLHFPTDLIVF